MKNKMPADAVRFWIQELYKELSNDIVKNIKEIKWVDLWHNQVGFLEEELPFSTPAVFIAFRSMGITDTSELSQIIDLQVDFYLYYETYSNTFNGSFNQNVALNFTKSLDELFKLFHGKTGQTYSSMRRTAFAPVDTGSAGNLYQTSFCCKVNDIYAMKEYEQQEIKYNIIGGWNS